MLPPIEKAEVMVPRLDASIDMGLSSVGPASSSPERLLMFTKLAWEEMPVPNACGRNWLTDSSRNEDDWAGPPVWFEDGRGRHAIRESGSRGRLRLGKGMRSGGGRESGWSGDGISYSIFRD